MNIKAYCIDPIISLALCPVILLKLAWESLFKRSIEKPQPGRPLKVAYVLTDSWVGAAGGAASHQIGFCRGLLAMGHVPIALTSQEFPTLGKIVPDYHALVQPPLPKGYPLSIAVVANNFFFLRKSLSILKKLKPDSICQRQSQMNYSGVVLSRLLGIPFMLEYNSPASWKASAKDRHSLLISLVSRFIEYLNVKAADRIMVVSDVLKQKLVERGVNADIVVVNPNGADADVFHPDLDPAPIRQRLKLDGKTVVGFAGVYRPWHGVEYLAQAVPAIARQHKEVQFLFIGDQGLVDLVTKIVGTDPSLGSITFATNIPHSEMPTYYTACDVLVSPHVHMADGGTFFGSPVKIFEYMAMGKPIVASGVGQIAELLQNESNALLTQPTDVKGIEKAVCQLAADPAARERYGKAARQTCLDRCTWRHNAERFIVAYQKVA